MKSLPAYLETLHQKHRNNRWMHYFSIFCRVTLAAGFFPSGMVKILGERFTSLSSLHPMGQYLEALHHTGYYYTSIGILQVMAAILLLFRRTSLLGAIIYLPIILNICILSLAVRFDGSLFTSPLMVLANLYVLWWNYDRIRYILPMSREHLPGTIRTKTASWQFPSTFFAGVLLAISVVILTVTQAYDVYPRNTISECEEQFRGSGRQEAGFEFCQCVHKSGNSLKNCLQSFYANPSQ